LQKPSSSSEELEDKPKPTSKPRTVKKPKKKIPKKKSGTEEGPFLCELCPEKKFKNVKSVNHHRRVVHLGKQICVCTICGKRFNTRSSLARHEILHTGKKHLCKTCGKRFTHSGLLNLHQKVVHEKVKRFCCHICGYRVFGASEFKVHVRRHNQDTSHFCHLCPKSFYTNAHLKIHILTHDGVPKKTADSNPNKKKKVSSSRRNLERNHFCNLCPKAFITNYHLRRHVLTHNKANQNNEGQLLDYSIDGLGSVDSQ